MDDIIEEHLLQRLAEVLRRLSRSVQYLGHVVSEKGVEADPPKISCVRDWSVWFPQFDKTFVVDTDASQDCLGAVLSQDRDRHVIAYASWVLTKAERQYCVTRQEMLAIVLYFRA